MKFHRSCSFRVIRITIINSLHVFAVNDKSKKEATVHWKIFWKFLLTIDKKGILCHNKNTDTPWGYY